MVAFHPTGRSRQTLFDASTQLEHRELCTCYNILRPHTNGEKGENAAVTNVVLNVS